MAIARPTPEQVRTLVQTTLTDEQIEGVIDDAVLLAGPCIENLGEDRQRAIVKYIAAHLIATTGRGGESSTLTSRKLGDASRSYARAQLGRDLAGTALGQQAIMLDPTGCLANLGLRRVIVRVA